MVNCSGASPLTGANHVRTREVCKKRTINDGTAHFSMILAQQRRQRLLAYIGKTYDSEVWRRLQARDHQRRLGMLRRKSPRAQFFVSHGSIDLEKWRPVNGRYPSRKRIDQIESLLILSTSACCPLLNQRKHRYHGITDHYELINRGAYRPLPRRILLTVVTDARIKV
jgi:hypothetical protein